MVIRGEYPIEGIDNTEEDRLAEAALACDELVEAVGRMAMVLEDFRAANSTPVVPPEVALLMGIRIDAHSRGLGIDAHVVGGIMRDLVVSVSEFESERSTPPTLKVV